MFAPLFDKIYNRVDHPINEYLNHFVAARYIRASAALGELALGIRRCQFSLSFLPTAVRLQFAAVGRVQWWHLELF